MFYRVDYVLALLLAGFVTGALLSRKTRGLSSSRLARGYYWTVMALLAVRMASWVCTLIFGASGSWTTFGSLVGDFSGVLFGALFGVAARRPDTRSFLTDAFVIDAQLISLAATFALAGIGKAFSLASMTEFFSQSGYSATFLKLIMIAEVYGAIGLLISWAAVPALIGLTIDMFGAVLTHVHNGDPLDDSTGAIGLLIRLLILGALLTLRAQGNRPLWTMRRSLLLVTGTAVGCLLVAFSGSLAVRHLSPPAPAATPAATK